MIVDDLYKSFLYYLTLSVLNTMLISHKRSSKHVHFIMKQIFKIDKKKLIIEISDQRINPL